MTNDILVVDDAATVRRYHGSILRSAGFGVAEAANGLEALETAQGRPFALCVVDVNMPCMDGYALVEALRREGVNRVTPIVMVSTEDRPADAERAYACGANAYMSKPVSADDLLGMARVLAGSTS